MLGDTCSFCINFWRSLHLHAFTSSLLGLLLLVPKSFQLVWAVQCVVGGVLSDLLHGERVAGFPTSWGLETSKLQGHRPNLYLHLIGGRRVGVFPAQRENVLWKLPCWLCIYSSRIYFCHVRHLLCCPFLMVEPRIDSLKSNKHLIESRWLQLSVSGKLSIVESWALSFMRCLSFLRKISRPLVTKAKTPTGPGLSFQPVGRVWCQRGSFFKLPAKARTMNCSQPCAVSTQPTLYPPWFKGG